MTPSDKPEQFDETAPTSGAFDGWVEGVPTYSVAVDGVGLQVGTSYTSGSGEFVFKIPVSAAATLDAKAYRRIVKACRRRLGELVQNNRAQSTLGILSPDDPPSIPRHQPSTSKWVVAFWLRLPTGMVDAFGADEREQSGPSKTLPHTRGKPVLAIRMAYSQPNVANIKRVLAAERHADAVGTWFPKPWALWLVWEWSTIPNVLGRLRALGYQLQWVHREGFPSAPPVADPALLLNVLREED